MPKHEHFLTLELPDSFAINPDGAETSRCLNERLRAWQGVGETLAVIIAVAGMMTGLPRHVDARLRVRHLSGDGQAVASGAP